ncbi:unnamed protein product, partial [Symbiodinium necroappetens]
YEAYKKAETVAEALSLGCKKGDLVHDQSKGYLIIAQDPAKQLRPTTAGSAPAKSSNLLDRLVAKKPTVDEVARSVLPPREISCSSDSGASDLRQPASPMRKRPAEALLSPRKKPKTEVGEVGEVEAESPVTMNYQDIVTQAKSVQIFKKAVDCPDEDVASTVPDESEEQDLQLTDRRQQPHQAQQRAEGGEEDGAASAAGLEHFLAASTPSGEMLRQPGALNQALANEVQDLIFKFLADHPKLPSRRDLSHESHEKTGMMDLEDSLENGDEKVTLLGGKQRRECSWTCGAAEFLDDLAGAIGYKLLFLLFVVEHVNRGFVADFSGQAESYVYKTYAVPAPRVQIYSGISKLPWALKPVVGLVSDVMPIGGYHKAPYMIGAVFVGSAAFLAVGAVPHSMLPVSLLVVCIFLQQSQLSVCDILAEARYAQQIQEVPAFGSHVLSFVWFGMNAGSVLGVLLSGLLLAHGSPKLPYLISALPAAMVLIPLFYGCLEEKMVRSEEIAERREKFYAQKEACFLSLHLGGMSCLSCLKF